MTTNIISLIPVLTFSLFVIIILALCVYKCRCCCKFKDAEHANTQRQEISTVYWDAKHANPKNIPIFYPDKDRMSIAKELRSRQENVLQSRPALTKETDNGEPHKSVSLSGSLGDEKMQVYVVKAKYVRYGGDSGHDKHDKRMKKSLADLINAADEKPVVWTPPPPPPPPDPPNPNS